MALEAIKSTQFDCFVDFATRDGVGEKSVAALGAKDSNGGYSITVTANDKVHKLFRGDTVRKDNDAVREEFKASVYAMFGGESKVPESVKKAMLMDDYGKGKPLTARRIMAVKNAVDAATAEFDAAVKETNDLFDQTLSDRFDFDQAELAKAKECISVAVKTCLSDKEALVSFQQNLRFILVNGASRIRDPNAVKTIMEGVRANLDEVRSLAASRKNPQIMRAGIVLITQLHGKALKPGLMANLVDATDRLDLSGIKKLSAGSSSAEIDGAVERFRSAQEEVMVSMGVERELPGPDEREAARGFIGSLIVDKCSPKSLLRALSSDNARKLCSYLSDVRMETITFPGLSVGVAEGVAAAASSRIKDLNAFKYEVELQTGVPPAQCTSVEEFNGTFDADSIGSGGTRDRLIALARDLVERERKGCIEGYVNGTGKGVATLRSVYESFLGPEPSNPTDALRKRNSDVARSMINLSIAATCRDLAAGRPNSFAQFIARSNVKLSNGAKLSGDFATARDQLAQFISGDPAATYAGLDPRNRNKVHVAMAFLSQELASAAYEGHSVAMDPKMNKGAFLLAGEPGGDTAEVNLSLGDDGALDLQFEGRKKVLAVQTYNGSAEAGPGSFARAKLSYCIPGAEMDRISSLDFSRYDDTAAQGIVSDASGMNNYRRAAESLGDFTIATISCQLQHSTTIN